MKDREGKETRSIICVSHVSQVKNQETSALENTLHFRDLIQSKEKRTVKLKDRKAGLWKRQRVGSGVSVVPFESYCGRSHLSSDDEE